MINIGPRKAPKKTPISLIKQLHGQEIYIKYSHNSTYNPGLSTGVVVTLLASIVLLVT